MLPERLEMVKAVPSGGDDSSRNSLKSGCLTDRSCDLFQGGGQASTTGVVAMAPDSCSGEVATLFPAL